MFAYLKAITGAIIAGLGTLATALEDGNVTGQEWVSVALAFVITLGAVYAVPNSGRGPR